MYLIKLKLYRYNNLFFHLLSDIYYVFIKKDRSSIFDEKKKLGLTPSWRDYARNPCCGIFYRFILFTTPK